jgi:ATP-dependent helicase/nuclease subunit B
MTVTEATGSTADAMWFLHATEGIFPSPSSPHPLLSVALQRALGMPGSDVSREEEHVRENVQHLLRASGSITFSYAAAAPEGEQRPSPSVQHLEGLQLRDATRTVEEEVTVTLEEISDPAPLPALPEGVFGGGYGVLMMQAACPFRAFAEKRLFSSEMPSREAGLSQADRGTQVHNVLEAFWERTRSKKELLAMTPDDRARRLEECIDIGFRAKSAGPWDEAYLRVQRERLRRLLNNWLDYEASRPDFEVEAVEKKVPDAAIGPLHLELRADRIDRIGDDLVLIDYKTGAATKAEWNGDRPDQPQLPLYAVAGGLENVKALMLGFVKVGKDGMKMDGLADDPKAMGLKSRGVNFNDQLDAWSVDLPRLAEEFVWGIADADPKDYPTTCEFCAQRVLCRVDTNRLLEAEDPDLEDEEAWA